MRISPFEAFFLELNKGSLVGLKVPGEGHLAPFTPFQISPRSGQDNFKVKDKFKKVLNSFVWRFLLKLGEFLVN